MLLQGWGGGRALIHNHRRGEYRMTKDLKPIPLALGGALDLAERFM